jgi:hypothetical protein
VRAGRGLADLDGLDADVERCGRVDLQLRQKPAGMQHRDGDQMTDAIVEHPGVPDISEDKSAQDLHQLRIVVGRATVARSEQSPIGGLGAGVAFGHVGVGLAGSDMNHCWCHPNNPSSTVAGSHSIGHSAALSAAGARELILQWNLRRAEPNGVMPEFCRGPARGAARTKWTVEVGSFHTCASHGVDRP